MGLHVAASTSFPRRRNVMYCSAFNSFSRDHHPRYVTRSSVLLKLLALGRGSFFHVLSAARPACNLGVS